MEQYQVLDIKRVFESPLNPRKTFNEKKMEELVESIRAKGVMVPLLVRPVGFYSSKSDPPFTLWAVKNEHRITVSTHETEEEAAGECDRLNLKGLRYEIAAGHRRYRAAGRAGLTELPLIIREMNDADFLEVLIIENDKHEVLEPLEQAQGYKTLMEKMHYDVAAISAKVTKSESWIYQRMKLLELIPEAQEQLAKEKITAGHAILIARLQPNEQKECLERIKEESDYGPGMSVRDLADHIERKIHLDLNSVSFKKTDPDLVPEAGTCATCPKRTGSAPALFPEIKKKDTCTDPSCFHKKVEAFTKQWIEKKSQDSDVPPLRLSDKDEYRMKNLPDDSEKAIPTNLYREITDKKKDSCSSAREGIVVTEGRNEGRVKLVCVDPECKTHHHPSGSGYSSSPEGNRYKAQQKAETEKRQLNFKIREAILDAILKAWPGKSFTKEDLLLLTVAFYEPIWHENQKRILARKGLKPKKEQYNQNTRTPMDEWLKKQSTGGLLRFLLEIALFRELERHGCHSMDKQKDNLIETAKRYGVDPKKIEAEFRKEVKEKKAEKDKKKSSSHLEKAAELGKTIAKKLGETVEAQKKMKPKQKVQTIAKKKGK